MKERLLRRPMLVAALAMVVALVPAMAFASHGFEDVPDTHNFHEDIAWMQETGVTRGCNPPENTEYCPERALIRGEEAAFFHRYDQYLRDSIEDRLLPEECEAGQHAEFDGEGWVCADVGEVSSALTVEVGETTTVVDTEEEILIVECAEGQVAITGSVNPSGVEDLEVSLVTAAGVATFTVTNNTGADVDVTPYVICGQA